MSAKLAVEWRASAGYLVALTKAREKAGEKMEIVPWRKITDTIS